MVWRFPTDGESPRYCQPGGKLLKIFVIAANDAGQAAGSGRNLAGTNWINLRSVSNLSTNPYQFLDPAGIIPPARFYRALMQ